MTELPTTCGRARLRAVFAFVALVLVLPLSGCGSADGGGAAAPAVPPPPSPEALAALPEATTFGDLATAPADPSPTIPTGGEVLHPKADAVIYRAPGAEAIARLPVTQVGSPTWVPVVARQGDWAQVLLPTRPNAPPAGCTPPRKASNRRRTISRSMSTSPNSGWKSSKPVNPPVPGASASGNPNTPPPPAGRSSSLPSKRA